MLPQRPSGLVARAAVRASGPVSPRDDTFEAVKARVVARLEDRLNPGASKRLPASVLRQSLRTHAEQVADQEAGRLTRADRSKLVEEVLAEVLGFGPLGELFRDPGVREVLIAGPHSVLARRDTAGWQPTGVRFRDEAHLRAALDRLATHADPVGGVTASVNLFDLKLPNGFRAVAVIPPEAAGAPAAVAFVRAEAAPPHPLTAEEIPTLSGRLLNTATTRPPAAPPCVAAPTPAPRPSPLEPATPDAFDPFARHRKPLTDRLIARLATQGVYDAHRVEVAEVRKIIATDIAEYCERERVYLGDDDRERLTLEILTTVQRE